jgi:hypothetical protein
MLAEQLEGRLVVLFDYVNEASPHMAEQHGVIWNDVYYFPAWLPENEGKDDDVAAELIRSTGGNVTIFFLKDDSQSGTAVRE